MRAPHLCLHAALRLIGMPHVMRRPASVNLDNICLKDRGGARKCGAPLLEKWMGTGGRRYSSWAAPSEPIFIKRASGG